MSYPIRRSYCIGFCENDKRCEKFVNANQPYCAYHKNLCADLIKEYKKYPSLTIIGSKSERCISSRKISSLSNKELDEILTKYEKKIKDYTDHYMLREKYAYFCVPTEKHDEGHKKAIIRIKQFANQCDKEIKIIIKEIDKRKKEMDILSKKVKHIKIV